MRCRTGRWSRWLLASLTPLSLALPPAEGAEPERAPLFPFVLPWDDATAGVTNVSAWLDRPAGTLGPVVVKDGHLFTGSKRLRLLGVNLCFGASFPSHDDAAKVAARLAKFGVNAVRFHHMDMHTAPDGIFAADRKTLDPGQLDRLDFLIARLKENGIYADLNLHVSRTYPGMPTWQGGPSYHKGVDNFIPKMIEWQHRYARDLLTHTNPYTKTRYADEPAVALVEINNENALLQDWWGGRLDEMPPAYAGELERQWNRWLTAKYPDFAALKRRLSADDAPGRVAIFRKRDFGGRTPEAQRDWIEFLWATERSYWTGMARFLKDELKVQSPIVGTQMGWSPAPIQAELDVIDSHAYWQHPRFAGRGWDPVNWTVQNIPMAGAPDGGTLPRLGLSRVVDKPFICTEYNHPAPNTYASETLPILAAYAALQDWDGIFAFAYSHRRDDWDARKITSFFDIDQHPTKMATLPAAAAMFLRGDVLPFPDVMIAPISGAIDQVRRAGPYLGADAFGLERLQALKSWVGLDLDVRPRVLTVELRGNWTWGLPDGRKTVLIDFPRSKAVIGDFTGSPFRLGDVRVAPGPTRQRWAVLNFTALDGANFSAPGRILITATGLAENTDMGWKNPEHTTVGRDWGRAPSLVEGVGATVALPSPPGRTRCWALDERGQRLSPVEVRDAGGRAEIALGPQWRTIWYEVDVSPTP